MTEKNMIFNVLNVNYLISDSKEKIIVMIQKLFKPESLNHINSRKYVRYSFSLSVTVSTLKWGQITMIYLTDCLLLINMYKS